MDVLDDKDFEGLIFYTVFCEEGGRGGQGFEFLVFVEVEHMLKYYLMHI